MPHKRLWISAAIIALVIVLGFMLSVPHTRELAVPQQPKSQSSVPAIAINDSFKKGVHTISGTIMAPDACATVTAQATLVGDASSTQSIALALTVPDTTGVCLEIPTSVPFTATLTAPKNLPISISFNGAPASTTAP